MVGVRGAGIPTFVKSETSPVHSKYPNAPFPHGCTMPDQNRVPVSFSSQNHTHIRVRLTLQILAPIESLLLLKQECITHNRNPAYIQGMCWIRPWDTFIVGKVRILILSHSSSLHSCHFCCNLCWAFVDIHQDAGLHLIYRGAPGGLTY